VRILKPILFFIVILFLLVFLFQFKFYYINRHFTVTSIQQQQLSQLAVQSIQTNDVPVASLLLYKNEIIGKGFNTVLRDTNINGHAEINAISNAIKKLGFKAFDELNRDSLVLLTTYEPCLMCKGAIIERRVKKVAFVKAKSLKHWWGRQFSIFQYELSKTETSVSELQDSLFKLHPHYQQK
jgi:tRNA(Arg) A34 adenosine deaminase TadA